MTGLCDRAIFLLLMTVLCDVPKRHQRASFLVPIGTNMQFWGHSGTLWPHFWSLCGEFSNTTPALRAPRALDRRTCLHNAQKFSIFVNAFACYGQSGSLLVIFGTPLGVVVLVFFVGQRGNIIDGK